MNTKSSTDSLSRSTSGGALKLLDDLDELASLLGTDISKPRVWKSHQKTIVEETKISVKKIELGKVSSSRNGEAFNDAVTSGRLDTTTGSYSDVNNIKCRLAEALEKELINADSAAFVNPDTQEVMDLHHAITHGFVQKSGHYLDPHSGKRLKLKECLQRYIIVPRDVDRVKKEDHVETTDDVFVPPLDLEEKHVVEVLDPSTEEWISVSVAITRGVYNAKNDKYFNLKTGELLTSQDAAQRNLVKLGDKLLDSSMDSTDTDILLEGHITGLKGRNINYSGEILSDEDEDNESDDFLFASSPRKGVPERPVWPGDGAQAIIDANSPLSTAALTSGSQADMVKVISQSGNTTPIEGSDNGGDERVDDSTPNNELESVGSTSSFVMTQSITTYESSHQTAAQHLNVQTTHRLMSMITSGESVSTVAETMTSSTALDESGSAILTANTSDVTLDLSNLTSADTTHEDVTFPTPPPPIDIKDSETEVMTHGSSTTSYQSSIFADIDPQEINGSVTTETTVIVRTAVNDTTDQSQQYSITDESLTMLATDIPVSSSTPIDNATSFKTTDGSVEKANEGVTVETSHEAAATADVEQDEFQAASAGQTRPLPEFQHQQNNAAFSKQPPIVNVLLQSMHRTLSASEPDEPPTSTETTHKQQAQGDSHMVSPAGDITTSVTAASVTTATSVTPTSVTPITSVTPTTSVTTATSVTPATSVTAARVATASVTTASVTTAHVATASVTTARVATASVTTASVTTSDTDTTKTNITLSVAKASPATIVPEKPSQPFVKTDFALDSVNEQSIAKKKVAENLAPNLVSSLTRHLQEKKTTIAANEKARSASESYVRPAAKTPAQRRESESAPTNSPSLKQLSQQLAMEAVLQRESIRSREGVTVSGLVKPSQRVANWRELEKKALTENAAVVKPSAGNVMAPKYNVDNSRPQSAEKENAVKSRVAPPNSSKTAGSNVEVSDTKSIKSVDTQRSKDTNNNAKDSKSLSSDLLAKVDAALESFESVTSASTQSVVHSPSPTGHVTSSSASVSDRAASAEPLKARSPDGSVSRAKAELTNWKEKEKKISKERALSPSKLAGHDPKSPSKVAFTYDPTSKKHKVTVYQHSTTLSYQIGVKLGLINIKTGRFRNPSTGVQLSVREACLQGLMDDKLPAITDILTGRVLTLRECVEHRLIDLDTGRVSDTMLKSTNISVCNHYIASLVVVPQPMNILDAVKVGLLNPHTGQFFYTLTKDRLWCTLEDAISLRYINGDATLVQDPHTHKFYYLSEALKIKLVNGTTGDILDTKSGLMYMTFYGALLCAVYRSVFDVSSQSILQPGSGQPLNVNQSISTSLLGHDTCLVYDTEQQKQVSFDEALASGIIDRATSSYVDKKTSASFSCEKAVEYGLIEPVGAEVCFNFNLSDCVESLYPPPSDTNSVTTKPDASLGMLKPAVKAKSAQKNRKQPIAEPEIVPDKKTTPEPPNETAEVEDSEGPSEPSTTTVVSSLVLQSLSAPPKAPPQKSQSLSSQAKPLSPKPQSLSPTPKPQSLSPTPKPQSLSPTPKPQSLSPTPKPQSLSSTPKPLSPKIADLLPKVISPKAKQTSPKPKASGIKSNVTVTERVIEIESKKRPQTSAHPDNISATEYFTKGDVQVEIPEEDESPIDSYEVKISNVEPQEFDWEKLPISPLRQRKIVVESKERAEPLRDKEIIIIERKEQGMTVEIALESGYINCETREFTHPITKDTVTVEQATQKGYITDTDSEVSAAIKAFREKGSVMEYKITKEVEYVCDEAGRGMPMEEAIECNRIDTQSGKVKHPQSLVLYSLADAISAKLVDGESAWFTSPSTKRLFNITEAISNKVMDSYGFWSSQLSGLKKSFSEGLAHGYIRFLSPDDHTRCLLTTVKKFAVHYVISPVSMEKIDYNVAVLEGIVNTVEGVYKSPATGDSLKIDDAISKGLIRGALLSTKTKRELLPNEQTITEKKCYTITHAKDTSTGKNLTIGEARTKGILDDDLTTFRDVRNDRLYSIQEAIDKLYLVASLDDPKSPSKGTRYVSTKIHKISSVVNPRTKQEIPANEAVKEGIINEQTGDYVNLDEDETMNMTSAIEKGLVKTRQVPTPVSDTPSFSITAITNPNNGELMTVADALRHGFLDRGRKHFFNPVSRTVYSLIEAINNGWVHVKSNMDTHGLPPFGQLHPTNASAQQTFTISSVKNVKSGEEVSVAAAVSQGILDSSKQRYRNNLTGEVLSLDQAIKRNMITLVPTGYTSGVGTLNQQTPTYQQSMNTYQTIRAPPTPTLQTRQRHGPLRDSGWAIDTPPAPLAAVSTTSIPQAAFNTGNVKGEPVYSQVRKDHTRHNSGPAQSAPSQPESIDIYKANTRGLISHKTGEVTVPQYGVTMLIDDALIQGFITTKVAIGMLLCRPFDPSSFTIYEAFQRGFVNPVTLAVRHPATGQFMSMESALTVGLLQPRASSNTSLPSVQTINPKANTLHSKKVRRSESMGRVENDRRRVQRSGILHTSVKHPLQVQSQEYHNYSSQTLQPNQPIKPARTGHVINNGHMTLGNSNSGSHLVNGKLYSAKSGHIINSNGQVVNLTDGEVMNLSHAERLGIVQRLTDKDTQQGQSYVPAANMMFNRDPVPFASKREESGGVMVVHVRPQYSSTDNIGDGLYSTMPSNKPINGAATLPPHLKQLDDYYAEIRH